MKKYDIYCPNYCSFQEKIGFRKLKESWNWRPRKHGHWICTTATIRWSQMVLITRKMRAHSLQVFQRPWQGWSLIFYISDHLLVADGCVPVTNVLGHRKFTTATIALIVESYRLWGKIVAWNSTSRTIYLVADGYVPMTKIPWSLEVYNRDPILVAEGVYFEGKLHAHSRQLFQWPR